MLRVKGDLIAGSQKTLQNTEIERLLFEILSPEQRAHFEEARDLDFAYSYGTKARFRGNYMGKTTGMGAVFRTIPTKILTLDQLEVPPGIRKLTELRSGLVLVTGPTGSGKSTTLAAMIDYINQTEHGHILTMEDPLEFVHPDKKCFVTQRQIGQDCASFREGLRRALRQDPDVILIGEMRDLETISMAISAAETGHLVFGTLHTTSAISTVDRIIDVFPTDAQQQVRVQMGSTLQGVISQTLVPKVGGGRVAAREILVATDAVKSLIREGKSQQILNLMQTGKQYGMTTLEDELLKAYTDGLITGDDAVSKANRPDDVRKRLGEQPQRPAPGLAAMGMSSKAAAPAAGPNGAPAPRAATPLGAGFGGVQGVKMRAPGTR
jgi:twitching motility protein PilT